MSNSDSGKSYWDRLPEWLQWDIVKHGRMTDEEMRYNPETGRDLDDLPQGLGRRWNSEIAVTGIKLVPRNGGNKEQELV